MYHFQQVPGLIHIDSLVTGLDVVRPRNFYYPGESHDFWELVLVREGQATVTADERIYELSRGGLIFHRPMEFHRIWTDPDHRAHVQIISFRASGSGMDRFSGCCFSLTDQQMEQFARITALFPACCEEIDVIEEIPPLRRDLAAVQLTALLLELNGVPCPRPTVMTGPRLQYSRIVEVMQAHVEENLSTEDLAALCSMSISNMKRIFRKYSDLGIAKYFCILRIRRAAQLLKQGCSISETAERLHYPDVSYFHTVFRRETGISPGQYQKTGQNLFLSAGRLRMPEPSDSFF